MQTIWGTHWVSWWSCQGSEKEGRSVEYGFLKNVGCSNEFIKIVLKIQTNLMGDTPTDGLERSLLSWLFRQVWRPGLCHRFQWRIRHVSGSYNADCMKSDMHVWIKTLFKPWPVFMWLDLKVVQLPCSTSTYEFSWSIEEQRLGMYEVRLLSWDMRKTLTIFLCNLVWHTGYPFLYPFLYFYIFCIVSSHSWKSNMLFPEYHNRFRYTDKQDTFH